MNLTTAHLITLWSAMIAKTEKGIERRLPAGCTFLQYRVLLQLSLPETACLRVFRLAHVLIARPADVQLALDVLETDGLVEHRFNKKPLGSSLGSCHDGQCRGCSEGGYRLTDKGRGFCLATSRSVQAFLRRRRAHLIAEDERLLQCMYYDALVKPGSFFAYRASSMRRGDELPFSYYMTVVAMLSQSLGVTTKRVSGLSLTDYRFLLELYPKRRGVVKRLRAKDVVFYLRVGKSYVSTAACRLEERGLIERVPDEDDARGILFQLTPVGERTVREVGEDIEVLLGGLMAAGSVDSSQLVRAMKALLRGTEECLDSFFDEEAERLDDPACF